ncbi:MAG TPA: acyltransferase domain-containing protein, partial [Pirellulaceae bacterium]
DRVMGHSVGEVAAAYVAGIYSLDDAVAVAFHRSRLQHATRGTGRMLAAGIPAAEARRLLPSQNSRVHLSAINSPSLVTFAGETAPLQEIADELARTNRFFKWLGIDYAFHSHLMEPIHDELLASLADIQPTAGQIPFISTVTGGQLGGNRLDADYWWRNVRLPVLFAPALATLIRRGDRVFLEIGPHPSLRSSIEDGLADQRQRGTVFHSLRTHNDESEEMLRNLAGLHTHGATVDWRAVHQSTGPHVRLPHYRWTHEKFWLESPLQEQNRVSHAAHPLLGLRIEGTDPTWEFQLDPRIFPYLLDHQIWDAVVFPAAGYGEIGLAVARALFPDQPHCVESLEIEQVLFAWEDKVTMVRVVVDAKDKSFRVLSATGNRQEWELHARGQLTPLVVDPL